MINSAFYMLSYTFNTKKTSLECIDWDDNEMSKHTF